MPTKDELLKEAEDKGVEVKKSASKAEIEEALKSNQDNKSEVTVNENRDEEAVHGTTKEGNDSEVKNTDSVPQNGEDSVETTDQTDSKRAKSADENRSKEEVEFADEANPNQKARTASTDGAEYDQTGNPRTGGKSYGVADDDTRSSSVAEENRGEPKEGVEDRPTSGEILNTDTNAREWSEEKQQSLAESLSDEENDIVAVVSTSVGDYVRVKFLRRGLAFGTYRSRSFSEADAQKWLEDRKKEAGL